MQWIMVHGDSDGIACGALALYAFKHMGIREIQVYFTHPAGLAEDLHHVKPGDSVFIADIALSEAHLEEIKEIMRSIVRSGGEVIYVDHHPAPLGMHPSELPGRIIYKTDASASELVYREALPGLGREAERIALMGAIGDYMDYTMWVKDALERWDKRHVYFEAGLLSQGLEGSRRLYDFKREVVSTLASGRLPSSLRILAERALAQASRDEEMRRYVERYAETFGLIAYVLEPPGSIGKAARYAMVSRNKPVGLAVEKRDGVAVMSLRASRSGPDLNTLLRRIAPTLGGTGGGHPWAAGARIPWPRLSDFLRLLDGEVSRILRRQGI